MSELNITIDYATVFLPCYWHLLNNGKEFLSEFFDIDFLYGGRDSGKSRHIAMELIIACMEQPYFKCLLIRKVLNTVRDSQYELLKSIIQDWGLEKLFKFNESRLEIVFRATGNGFYGRGLDDVGRIKSFNNPSHCWIEEGNQITSNDFVVILTSLRAHQRVKTWFSFNPECDMNYTDFWLYQDWFSHSTELAWTWTKTMTLRIHGVNTDVEFKARATHTTYKDNEFCQPQRIALYESYKNSKNNAYWYQTYTLGLWGYKRTGGEYLKCFEEGSHTTTEGYEAKVPLHIVADNNVNPYIAISAWQIYTDRKLLRQVAEFPCRTPANTASKAAAAVLTWMQRRGYGDVVFVYGDATANKKSTEDDEGRSFFAKFIGRFTGAKKRVVNRVGKSNPSTSISGAFVNEILEAEFEGWTIEINVECRSSIEDYMMTKEDINGKVLKVMKKDEETGVSQQKYGHFTDDLRYLVTSVLRNEYVRYQQSNKKYFGM